MVRYLETPIAEKRQTPTTPCYGMTAEGYTGKRGAPTSWMIRLEGERIWRRVMVWQFSNAGTAFVRIKGLEYVVRDSDLG